MELMFVGDTSQVFPPLGAPQLLSQGRAQAEALMKVAMVNSPTKFDSRAFDCNALELQNRLAACRHAAAQAVEFAAAAQVAPTQTCPSWRSSLLHASRCHSIGTLRCCPLPTAVARPTVPVRSVPTTQKSRQSGRTDWHHQQPAH